MPSSASDWTTPAGNGSSDAFSVNNWTVSDYFEFDFDTTGYISLVLDFEQGKRYQRP